MSPGAPGRFDPSLVMAQISKAVEAEKTRRAFAMQQVQQQNAQQPPGTIAQQVLAQAQQIQQPQQMPVMAAHGGMMHSYAGGGAVAFQEGGRTYGYAPDYEESRRVGINLSPYDSAEVRKDKLRRLEEYRRTGVVPPPREPEPPEYREMGASPEEMAGQSAVQRPPSELRQLLTPNLSVIARAITGDRPSFYGEELYGKPKAMPMPPAINVPPGRGMAEERMAPQPQFESQPSTGYRSNETTFDLSGLEQAEKALAVANKLGAPESERQDILRRIAMLRQQAPLTPTPAAPPRAALTPEEEGFYSRREATLQGRRNLPPEVLAGRQGIAALAAQNLAAQRAEAEQFGTEARQRRDEAMARAGRNIFTSPDAASLFSLAGSIDTRPGQALGSASRGLANLLAKQEEARAAAGREYATAQQTERMLQANIRQANMLEEQRKQAVLEREPERLAQIEDALARNSMERSQLMRQRQEYAEKMALEGRKVGIEESKAGKLTELELAMARPEEYARVMRQKAEAMQSRKSPEQIRKEDLERYADNWEKLDMLQKNELAKQGVTNFQQYVRMRDQMAGLGGAPSLGAKVMTMADVQATATASGKTVDEVRKAALAAGYTIQ